MNSTAFVLVGLVLSGCAYGPTGGFDDPEQVESPPTQNASEVSHVPSGAARERAWGPDVIVPAADRNLTQRREPIVRGIE
jgi:hypothetical protein